ncbi:Hsp20/alpha crystallin family protein [Streptomyces sp. NPDC059063]|uniref:Hsp20/alpha crystallin family protein n=1 Tax=unclassified Streptomyces TaxID=2593676 RepID=UPI0036C181CB
MNLPKHRTGGPLEPHLGPGRGLGDWNPFTELETMWRDMGRAFEHHLSPVWAGAGWVPVAEEEETDDAYVIRAELPGVPRENISVDIDAHELRISGELSEEQRGRTLSRRSGRFFYRTSLPGDVDPDRAEAELTDGILRVRLPKAGGSKRRRVSIGGDD